MTELQRYLAEEVAEDHADGIITRREAMRRLGLLGVSGAGATALLAAEKAMAHDKRDHHPRGDAFREWAPVATDPITWSGPNGTMMGAWASAGKHAKGGVLVIHENRGLNEHIRQVAGRFAAVGFNALAIDLLSEEGGTGSFPDEAAVAAALSQVPPERFDQDNKSGVGELKRRTKGRPLSAIGFCFGGGMVWRLLAAKEPRLSAAAPFYGPFPEGGNLKGNKAAVLGVYGGLDARVNATRETAHQALHAAKLRHEILTFTEADHAFFNHTGARFNAPAAAEAWRRVVAWFDD
jgi:carboxymethylenebutenolidase